MSSKLNTTDGSEKPDGTAYHDVSITPAPAQIDPEGHVAGTNQGVTPIGGGKSEYDEGSSRHNSASRVHYEVAEEARPGTWYGRMWKSFKTPGSALQIIVAAVIAIAIGMAVNATVDDIPNAALVILGIPGRLWLRSLTAVVLPLIITAMIISIQRLKELSSGGSKLAKWSIIYYFSTTLIAIGHSILMTALVWRPLYDEATPDDQSTTSSSATDVTTRGGALSVEETVQTVFDSFITNNIVNALASNALLAVLIVAIVVGSLIKGPSSRSPLLALVKEVDRLVTIVVTFLIKLAPIAVFSLILSNIMRLDMSSVGKNLGILIGNSLTSMFIHLLIVFPIIFYAVCRMNPYTYWLAASRAWITAWGTASSAATLPVTMRVVMSQGVNREACMFCTPLGCLVNMDGTAIYFPAVIVYLAASQGITLNAGQYIIVLVLATLASIGTTPIPSSSLVLTVMIADTIGVPTEGAFALVVAIDWFIDRFRTALNVSSDVFGARIIATKAGLQNDVRDTEGQGDDEQAVQDAIEDYNREVRGDRF